ncbi:2-isopropylmalate synthase [Anaerohalosphaera lusitana]|uniref:(R)-citramalate synthase n=1 Tax=Anaerohalosphaera lusitana TaxID=1936003 RepID=A0A1U9NGC1_9BACT|nr:citramalate synthase [Anaerohalosphaera lusitana]AQT66982.1 2-isopropylmalate synthase [Anaerohalosphaera lusitana]
METLKIYDTTLRDGMQAEGVSFSLEDKLLIARRLDEFGLDYIEGGYPLSNPKEEAFFKQVMEMDLANARICAFGNTKRKGVKVEEDTCMRALLDCGAPVTTIVGKSWDMHVTDVLRCSLEDNLKIVDESVRYLKSQGREVVFDAEHFFDGYKANPEYAMKVAAAAAEAGADALVLCETNGGCLPQEVFDITEAVCKSFPGVTVGMHAHNDSDCAVANSVTAVAAGARHIQGTINGLGERTGNANLCTIIPNLAFKMSFPALKKDKRKAMTALRRLYNLPATDKKAMSENLRFTSEVVYGPEKRSIGSTIKNIGQGGQDVEKVRAAIDNNLEIIASDEGKLAAALKNCFDVLPGKDLTKLTELSHFVFEIANLSPITSMPYVGESAFAHKGGLHIDALRKNETTYEHISPGLVGNERRFLISELSGSANVLAKLERRGLAQDKELARGLLKQVQDMENEGYQFEAAEASFDILIKKALGQYRPAFDLERYHVTMEQRPSGERITEATVKLQVDGVTEHTVSEGDGPVNALDLALRKSLENFYPQLKDVRLIDYKVRVVNPRAATAARVRVVIESRDSESIWGTVGVSENLVDASWKALVDSIEYKLLKDANALDTKES